jgi:hypothetical protein
VRSSVYFNIGPDPFAAGGAVNARVADVQLAACLLAAAAAAAEAEIASLGVAGREATHWAPEALAAAGPLGKIIRAAAELERTLAGRPAVTAMPSPSTLKTIEVVEAARASMPSASTRASIVAVESARAAMITTRRVE